MWHTNALTERLNLDWPILQAPMGGITTPLLAAEVSNAGGLGGLGMWGLSSEDGERQISGFRQQSGRSLNVNFPLWDDPGDLTGVGTEMIALLQKLYDAKELGVVPQPTGGSGGVNVDQLDMLQKLKPEVVSFHFGLPDAEIMHALKDSDIFILCSATTVSEAKILETQGVDAIIAQGIEAGGHRGTFSNTSVSMQPSLFALLPQVVDAVNVPVIAAGGIADGRAIAAALMMGASGVQVGTAFLGCEEANVIGTHRAALSNADDVSSVVTDVISGRPARFIRNNLIESLSVNGVEPLPFPAQGSVTLPLEKSGDEKVTALYAGQSVALIRRLPAADLIRALADETSKRLATFC